ncbi:MAG: hypothetical protein U0703_24375 [Anaerolineae bacterium]
MSPIQHEAGIRLLLSDTAKHLEQHRQPLERTRIADPEDYLVDRQQAKAGTQPGKLGFVDRLGKLRRRRAERQRNRATVQAARRQIIVALLAVDGAVRVSAVNDRSAKLAQRAWVAQRLSASQASLPK